MNKRIQELALQAKVESSQWMGCKPATTITYDELEKFAQLIVRECCDIFVELRTRPADLVVKDVKKHFGIES